jgi:hypothetical protein
MRNASATKFVVVVGLLVSTVTLTAVAAAPPSTTRDAYAAALDDRRTKDVPTDIAEARRPVA